MLVPMRTSWRRHRHHAVASLAFRAASVAGFAAGLLVALYRAVPAPQPCHVEHAPCLTQLLRHAALVGRAVLEAAGNAVDAAAATVFALNVARPQSCGIGGGGFMVYRSRTARVRALDFREIAPAAITPDQFQGQGLYRFFTGHTT